MVPVQSAYLQADASSLTTAWERQNETIHAVLPLQRLPSVRLQRCRLDYYEKFFWMNNEDPLARSSPTIPKLSALALMLLRWIVLPYSCMICYQDQSSSHHGFVFRHEPDSEVTCCVAAVALRYPQCIPIHPPFFLPCPWVKQQGDHAFSGAQWWEKERCSFSCVRSSRGTNYW